MFLISTFSETSSATLKNEGFASLKVRIISSEIFLKCSGVTSGRSFRDSKPFLADKILTFCSMLFK